MAIAAYRLVGPDPQATHWLCDTEAEVPASGCNPGDTAYTKDTGRVFSRGNAAWIERPAVGHSHGQGEVTGLTAALSAKADVAALASKADVAALAGKADLGHGHAQVEVTGLEAALAARAPSVMAMTTADYPSTASTASDIPGLRLAIKANRDTPFMLVLFYRSAAVGCGIGLSMVGPAVPAGRDPLWDSGIQVSGGPSTSAVQHKAQTASGALHVTSGVDVANVSRVARFFGLWPTDATPGDLVVRCSSEVAGTEVRVMKGSYLITW